jgi:hypothetical protein
MPAAAEGAVCGLLWAGALMRLQCASCIGVALNFGLQAILQVQAPAPAPSDCLFRTHNCDSCVAFVSAMAVSMLLQIRGVWGQRGGGVDLLET